MFSYHSYYQDTNSNKYSLPSNLEWQLAVIEVGMFKGGGRLTRVIIRNTDENYFLYSTGDSIYDFQVECSNNLLTIYCEELELIGSGLYVYFFQVILN